MATLDYTYIKNIAKEPEINWFLAFHQVLSIKKKREVKEGFR